MLEPLDEERLRQDLQRIRRNGIEALAIVFMHAYRNPVHEVRAGELARAAGFTQVSLSHEAAPVLRVVSRGDTAVVDAYLSPLLARYVAGVRAELERDFGAVPLYFMQSNGGLTSADAFRGMNSILSGPAGGLVGMAKTGTAAGFSRLIGFDMGGTSTDVSLFDGEYPRRFDNTVAGVRLNVPMMSIHTVAAGGGSLLRFASERFQVGPDSAGANPGPACYRRGGPLTVTDANVLLGRLHPQFFPSCFGPGADEPLDAEAVRAGFLAMQRRIAAATGGAPPPLETIAEGFLEVAVATMANAIKHVSIRQGHDPAQFALYCFGGAAGQLALRVAAALGIRSVLVHPHASVLSAHGIGLADLRTLRRRTVEAPLAESLLPRLREEIDRLGRETHASLVAQGAARHAIRIESLVSVRTLGSDAPIDVSFDSREAMIAAFDAQHRRRYGFGADTSALQVAAVTVEAIAETTHAQESGAMQPLPRASGAAPEVEVFLDGAPRRVRVIDAALIAAGEALAGPLLIVDKNTTLVVEPGWIARRLPGGELLLEETRAATQPRPGTAQPEAVQLEIFNNLFMHIAEQMGAVLEQTAASVNIKERLDFSCALFDAHGELIANAPHMPVHLGSMGASVQAVRAANRGQLRRGDVYMLNAPYDGGTHLPDITVITPVFAPAGDGIEPDFFVASRAHHADIGGITPGSMPPMSRSVTEEGVLFTNFKLVRGGEFQERSLREQLGMEPWPARNPDQNVADLKAQIAANERGIAELERVIARHGLEKVRHYMRRVQDNAEECVRRAVGALASGAFRYEMDNGQAIAVRIEVDSGPPQREHRFRRHLGPGERQQFQRAARRVHRRGALCVSHAGGGRHSAERGLHAPSRGARAGRLAPQSALPRRGGRRERGDFAVYCRCALRRSGTARRLAGHDEQLHVRQRAPPVLRDHRRRVRRRSWVRRCQRGADAHDQLAPHRSGGAGAALSRAAARVPHPHGLGRRRREPRRRRRGAARAVPRVDDCLDPFESPSHRALWPERRGCG